MPEPLLRPDASPPRPRSRLGVVAGAVLLLAGLGLGAALSGIDLTMLTPHPFGGDRALSAQESAARLAGFQAAGVIPLTPVPQAEREQAIASMQLPPQGASDLEKDLASGAVRLVYLTLWDDRDEDGDQVRVAAAGFDRTLTLAHARQRLAVPLPPAGGEVRIAGVYDGGGGVTVALEVSGAALPLPGFAEGDTVTVTAR